MVEATLTSCATESTQPPDDPGHPFDPDKELFSQVRQTADAILQRVRDAFTPPGFAQLRCLVVDDHPDAADSLAVVLELLGCPVRACHNGWSALAAAEEFQPQVCLIDLMMPGMDGLELAARLKVWAGSLPLILVATTALGDEDIKARTAIVGFHEHLVKPVDPPTLRDTLTRLGRVLAKAESDAPRHDLHLNYDANLPPIDGENELGHS